MSEIRIAQFFKLKTANTTAATHFYQNYFVGQTKTLNGLDWQFAPFQAEGAMASLNGENDQLTVLFPNTEVALRLVEQGDFNRLSEMELITAWLNGLDEIQFTSPPEFYIGIGASFSETTIELRYRSAIDSVGSAFPARTLSRNLVGPLPVNSELYLR